MSQLAMQLGSSAVFSTCRTYRYVLRRSWGDAPSIVFIMLNPSTADETQDDPTIRRCIGYAQKWGYGGLIVTNIFALRSTNPKALYSHSDPIGPENNQWLCSLSSEHDTICAWGAHGTFKDRGNQIIKMLTEHRGPMMALRITKDGHPAHPLYLPGNLQPFEFANPESGYARDRMSKISAEAEKFMRTLVEWDGVASHLDLGPQMSQQDNSARQFCKRRGWVTYKDGYWRMTDAGREALRSPTPIDEETK